MVMMTLGRKMLLAALFCLLTVEAIRFTVLQDIARAPWSRTAQKTITTSDQCKTLSSLPIKRVAIIGAGSAGASTAYYLSQFLNSCANLEIDVYEKNPYVGGRSTTVNVYNDPSQPVELGASIFVQDNRNLVAAYQKFNLSIAGDDTDGSSSSSGSSSTYTSGLSSTSNANSTATDSYPELGIWDGSQFVFTMNSDESIWKLLAKLIWKYGTSPVRTQALTRSTIGKFLKMYEPPYFPWTTLTETVRDVGLDSATSSTGSQYLSANSIVPPFSTDLIQSATRVNYAQNLDQIHGLETMVCMAAESGTMQIQGGNWQIFNEMLKYSGANVHLNTTVEAITRCNATSPDGLRFEVQTKRSDGSIKQQSYHDVVIAAPYQSSGIDLYEGIPNIPAAIDYVKLHVTLFSTPSELSPDYFGGTDPVPLSVLTTLPKSAISAANGTGATPFFSVAASTSAINPKTGASEMVYKIFSREAVPDALLIDLLYPSSSSLNVVQYGTRKEDVPLDSLVTWKYTKVWHSYPYLPPRVKFQEFVLDEGLWYTAGIESFISTMETSSLSGMNVAASMKNAWGHPYSATTNSTAKL